ncbi:MAG: hypothetical protein HYT79_02365 [Elusimicrobia bacterium]|nr:hypothetical protein [Elusimicrobiota bacterium]
MPKKKILLLYAAPDSGHAQAAHAVVEAIKRHSDWDAAEDNVIRYFPHLGGLFLKLYHWMIANHSGVWGRMHDNPELYPLVRQAEGLLYDQDIFKLRQMLERHRPDAVISTHALPIRILAGAKSRGRLDTPLFGVTTDFWAHRYWASVSVDRYFASSKQAADDLARHGVDAGRIETTGIPLRGQFLRPPAKAAACRRLKLDPKKPSVMVMGGSLGLLPFDELLSAAQSKGSPSSWQWLFVLGGNEEALRRVKSLRKPEHAGRIRIYGFEDNIVSLMSAADCLITKGGALTAAEALAVNCPLIIHRPIPGQEEGNARLLVKAGAALREDQLDGVLRSAALLFRSPSRLANMREAARKIARPQAALDIVKALKESLR